MTPHELIQQAIDKIKLPEIRAQVQAKYNANPDAAVGMLASLIRLRRKNRNGAADFLDGKRAIDPDKLKIWLDLLVKLLPLLLMFL